MLFPAFAAEVTISDAVESAKANSISLEIAKEQLEQSLRSASTLSSCLPDLSLKGTLTKGGSLAAMSYTPFSADISAGISWRIGTSMFGKEESAAVKRTLAELEFLQSTESVETATVNAYLTLARSESSVKQAERKAENLYETHRGTITTLKLKDAKVTESVVR